MNKKQRRLEIIRQLLLSNCITDQDDLLKKLSTKGVLTTQATLSRDLKELKVAKIPDSEGTYSYRIQNEDNSLSAKHLGLHVKDIVSLDFSGSLAVLHTSPGFASAVAGIIDMHLSDDILGSIAGDDTIFIAMKENIEYLSLVKKLKQIIPNLLYLSKK